MRRGLVLRLGGALALALALAPFCLAEQDGRDYKDRHNYFSLQPPKDWHKKEFVDPRSKVEFFVPMEHGPNRKASLFVLAHPVATLSPDGRAGVNLRSTSADRVARLRQAGAKDARFDMITFCGVDASQVDATLPNSRVQMRAIWFVKYDRSFTISFTAQPAQFKTYWKVASAALDTFTCVSPDTSDAVSEAERDRIQREQIRVWVEGLKGPDLLAESERRLLEFGPAAISALEEATRTGTDSQRERARRLLQRLRSAKHTGSSEGADLGAGAVQDWKAIAGRRPTLWDYQPPQLDKDQRSKLARAQTVTIAVEQVYTTVNRYDPLGDMALPFADIVQRVLGHAGIRVVGAADTNQTDFTVRIFALGWASRTHKIDTETWAYMDAEIRGTLSIAVPGAAPYVEAFESGVNAEHFVSEYQGRQHTHPSDAPFFEAFQQFDHRDGYARRVDKLPNSGFIPRLLTIVASVYGIDPLIEMVTTDDDVLAPHFLRLPGTLNVLQRHAMKALERITGESFGKDPAKWKEWSKKAGASSRLDRHTKLGDRE